MTFVPYPGNAPALNAVLGQQVTSMFATLPNVSEYLKAGKLRALGRQPHAGRAAAGRSDCHRVRL